MKYATVTVLYFILHFKLLPTQIQGEEEKRSCLPALKEEQIIWTPGRGRSVNFVGLGLQIKKNKKKTPVK